jgi:hypothetical protein
MACRPAIAEQQDQFAGMLDRVAEVDGIEPEIAERTRRRRLAGFPVRIASELAKLFAVADARDRRRRRGFGCRRPGEGELGCENGQKPESHLEPQARLDFGGMQAGSHPALTSC